MRVGLVVTGGVDRSGRERVIPSLLWLIERLARRHELHVFALHQYEEACTYPLLGATVHDLGRVRAIKGLGRRAQFQRLMAALTRVGKWDLLQAYWAVPAGVITTAAAARLGVPSIVVADSGEWVSLPDIRYGLQRRWVDRRAVASAMRGATRVVVCSHRMAAMARRHGVHAEVIPLGVPRQRPDIPRPVDGPPWRLLHVASINRVKDHATLLSALAHVVAREPRVHLDIVGEDTRAGAVQQKADELQLRAHVTFHGFQPTDRVMSMLGRAHLHVVSSRHEAAGVVTLEAAAAGVPTVGTRVGHVADFSVAQPPRAVGVAVGDSVALAQAISDLLLDPAQRERIAAAALAWAQAHDADWSAAEFDALYRELAPAAAR